MSKINRISVAIFLLVLSSILLISGCVMDYSNSMLKVHNSSDINISIVYANNNAPAQTNNSVDFYVSANQIIYPDSTNPIFKDGKGDAWHYYISSGVQKKLFIYVFSVDDLIAYRGTNAMNDLLATHKYLKMMEYSEEELIKNDWLIDYKDN